MPDEASIRDSAHAPSALPKAPVAATRQDAGRLIQYINQVCEDLGKTAQQEALRLAPYMTALSRQLFADLLEKETTQPTSDGVKLFGPPQAPAVIRAENLTRLFTAIARDSQNTILSEMIVASKAVFDADEFKSAKYKKFSSAESYRGFYYGLGFIQTPTDNLRGSVSVSVFSLSSDVLEKIPEQRVDELLRALQVIVTAGNHDMQHHYTNKLVNSAIAKTTGGTSLDEGAGLRKWGDRYFSQTFSDRAPQSYESWLMLNHGRVFERMDSTQHQELFDAVESYFDILGNIKAAVEPEMVDYLSMMACFAMQRYLRLDNPFMLYAVERTQAIDAKPETALEEGATYKDWSENGNKDLSVIVEAYPQLFGADSVLPEYQKSRLLQVAELEVWSAKLLAPVTATSELDLAAAHKRVAEANIGMVKAAANESRLIVEDGEFSFTGADGSKVSYVARKGELDAQDRPALVIEYKNGNKREEWYTNGDLTRSRYLYSGSLTEEWYSNGVLHREDGPAKIGVYTERVTVEAWYRHGSYFKPTEEQVAAYRVAEKAKQPPSLVQKLKAAIFSMS